MQLATYSAISLKHLLPDALFFGTNDILVRSCSGSWSECQPDDLFVAIVEAEEDGHEYVKRALDQGASGILSERFLAVDCPICVVEDSRAAFARLCQALAGGPSQRAQTIGVTGSQGKTVTCRLLDSILQEAGYSTGLTDSISAQSNSPGLENFSAPQLAAAMRDDVNRDGNHLLIELPSQLLAKKSAAGIELDLAIITNLRREHLHLHGSTDNYVRSKLEMLDLLSDTGIAVLNADDRATQAILDQLAVPSLTFGVKHPAEISGKLIDRCLSEQTFLLSAGNDSAPVRTRIVGDGHVYNCLAAATAAFSLGIELPIIVRGLERIEEIPGRLQRMECGQPFSVFVDAARTPNQLASALRSLRQVVEGKTLCVFSTDDQAGSSINLEFGRVADKLADRSFLTSPSSGSWTHERFHQVIDGFRNAAAAHVIANRLDAIEYALQQASPGDCVLVAGAGERPIAVVGQQDWVVTDADVCQSWLYGKPTPVSEPEVFRIDDYREDR